MFEFIGKLYYNEVSAKYLFIITLHTDTLTSILFNAK